MEVKAAEVSCHVHNFPDEKKSADFAALHGLGGEFVGVNPSDGDLRLGVAFSARRKDGPRVNQPLPFAERGVRPGCGRMSFQPAIGQTIGQKVLQFRS